MIVTPMSHNASAHRQHALDLLHATTHNGEASERGAKCREQYASVAFRQEDESNLERNFARSLYARLDNRILYIGRGSIQVIRFVRCAPPLQCFGEGAGGWG